MEPRARSGAARAAAATLAAALLLLPLSVQAQDAPPPAARSVRTSLAEIATRSSEGLAIGFDVLVLRPLGAVATAVGAVLFVPAALLAAPNGSEALQEARETFITVPAESVYKRRLGEF